jgi:hypothetical protein
MRVTFDLLLLVAAIAFTIVWTVIVRDTDAVWLGIGLVLFEASFVPWGRSRST